MRFYRVSGTFLVIARFYAITLGHKDISSSIEKMFGLVKLLYGLIFASTVPYGFYSGSKTLFGETIHAVVDLKTATTLDFGISGDFSLDCKDEVYTIVGSSVQLTNIGVAGDCAHDALSDNKIALKGIVYDAAADTITVSVKYSIANVDILLTKDVFFTENDCVSEHKVDLAANECGDLCLDPSIAPFAETFGGVTKGDCAALGYTTFVRVEEIDMGPFGASEVTIYTKPVVIMM